MGAIGTSVILGIDGGGTSTRCLVIDREGRIRGRAEAGPSNHLQVGWEAAAAAVAMAIDRALAAAALSRETVVVAAAGLAGVDYDGREAEAGRRMLERAGCRHSVVYGDMVIAHRGALAGAPGVVALAGTGSAVLGIDAGGRMVKVGGWGPLYGNEGSAYQLAHLGLIAAAHAVDRRGPATMLVERLAAALNVTSFRDTVDVIYGGFDGQREIASLAPVVCRAAQEGDGVALAACVQTADDLAAAVWTASRTLASGEPALVSWQGALLERCGPVRQRFEVRLRHLQPGVELRPPCFAPVVGAYLLGCREAGWPFPAQIGEWAHGSREIS